MRRDALLLHGRKAGWVSEMGVPGMGVWDGGMGFAEVDGWLDGWRDECWNLAMCVGI